MPNLENEIHPLFQISQDAGTQQYLGGMKYSLQTCLDCLVKEKHGASGFSDASRPEAEHVPSTFDHPIWRLGWTDGRLLDSDPASDHSSEFFQNEAALWISRARHEAAAEVYKLNAYQRDLEGILTHHERETHKLREQNSELTHHSSGGSRWYFLVLGVVIMIAALLLLVADYPLTAQLAGRSLGFEDVACVDIPGVASVQDALLDCSAAGGNLIRAEKQFFNFSYFLDVSLLAGGLLLSTFLFKLTFDALLRGDFSSTIIGTRHRAKALFLASGIAIATFITLGVMRSTSFMAETTLLSTQAMKSEARVDELVSELKRKSLELPGASSASPENSQAALQSQLETERKRFADLVRKSDSRKSPFVPLGFILLTLLFPLASGILFHFGTDYIKRFSSASTIDKRLQDQAAVLEDNRAAYGQLVAKLARAQEDFRFLQEPDAISLLAKQWHALYRHGEQRGALSRLTILSTASTYERARYIVEKRLA